MKSKNPNSQFSLLLLLAVVFLSSSCGGRYDQSETLTEYSRIKNRDLSALYFYPTTIRMLSKVLGDQGGEALEEIEKGRVFFSWDDDDAKTRDVISQLKTRVEKEGYEMLMQMKSSGNKVDVYLLDRDVDDYILFVDGDQGIFVLEILGNLSVSSIKSLSELDMSKVTDIFELDESDFESKIDSTQSQKK